jgi:hypothetical protein
MFEWIDVNHKLPEDFRYVLIVVQGHCVLGTLQPRT